MPPDYAALQSTATRMIATMGRSAVLRAIDDGTETPCTALMSHFGARERDGRLISYDDRRALISVEVAVAPDPEQHRLVLDGKSFRIVAVRTVNPATTMLYYDCQVRA